MVLFIPKKAIYAGALAAALILLAAAAPRPALTPAKPWWGRGWHTTTRPG